jgi:hypothetical protein
MLKKLLAAPLLLALAAGPVVAGDDFTAPTDGPRPLAASHSNKRIQPQDDIVFAHDSAALLDSGVTQIDRVAKYLKRNPKMKLVIAGHANSVGGKRYNEDLATRRANLVRMHLIGHGISSDRLLVLVYGENDAERKPSPIDRRVVVFATTEAPTTIARRELKGGKVISAVYTRGKALVTETGGHHSAHVTLTEQVASRR